MTMLSFRVPEAEAALVGEWAARLQIERSELLRTALRAYIVRLASEVDAQTWVTTPLEEAESSLAEVADWGPADDWSDWGDPEAR